ncbi:SRPBCC domain-containing protein [Cellulomonas sp. URHD0024]|uniref:SRPBCC family protein n=1 Tax=Cellulomonas sp. URHD0024 TaxID=1302620 RepID=UPI000426C457|nr:SRPBCC domain-containing protein [Cellulomonas sp. URHD0024]
MSREFEIVREHDVDASPEEVWDALTTGIGGWLWPMEYEPRTGGKAPFDGVVAAWDPPHHLVGRNDGPDGWFNQVEEVLTPLPDGRTHLRYVHSGVFVEDWDNQFDGAGAHTDFYLATLRSYLAHFSRRPVTYSSTDAPASSNSPDGFTSLRAGLGLPDDVAVGTAATVSLPSGDTSVVVDYAQPNFLGLRTDTALVRLFGRNAYGAPVGIAVHDFADDATPSETTTADWSEWLAKVYA